MVIKAGQYYRNKKNRNTYQVKYLALQVTNNEEIDVVVYTPLCEEEMVYVRSINEFREKFLSEDCDDYEDNPKGIV